MLAFATAACCMATLIRSYKPELSIPFLLSAGTIIIISLLDDIGATFSAINGAFEDYGLNTEYLKVAVKVIAIAYLIQFSADMCRDANESALAAKVEMAGRVLILSSAVPVILGILDVLGDFTSMI